MDYGLGFLLSPVELALKDLQPVDGMAAGAMILMPLGGTPSSELQELTEIVPLVVLPAQLSWHSLKLLPSFPCVE